ncbi:unnamed protein product, partial [Oppiella nova]
VQARFEQVPRNRRTDPPLNATALMAVAARDNISSIVEFRLRPVAARWRYQMYVIVDKEYVFWWDESMKLQYFKGVTLYQPAGIQNMSHVIAMFDSGVGVEVMTDGGHLTVHVYMPYTFLNGTGGLLGLYSRDIRDDFTLPNGQQISLQSTQEDIHMRFGKAWRVQERVAIGDPNQVASLFHHDAIPFAHYDDPNFLPDFGLPPRLPDWAERLRPEMESVCADSVSCQYDYVITLNKDYAKVTKQHEAYALYLANEANRKYPRCPALPKPLNGRKSENKYWPGTIVRFSCDDGYRLVGNETRLCREDGQWSLGADPKCIQRKVNYEQIQWITHQDNYEGLKGSAAYVGFNAGNTTRTYEFRPFSQNPRVSYLTTRGCGNGLRGRHFFQIDGEVWPGACIEKAL